MTNRPRNRTLLALVSLLLAGSVAFAQMGDAYSVTVTNTSTQPISPPILISHALEYQPVVPGSAAEPALWLLAEDGDASELSTMARVAPGVHEVVTAPGPVPPGESVTLEIHTTEDAQYLTLLGMLVVTNDAFVFWGSDVGAAASMDDMGAEMDEGTGGDMMGMAPAIYDGVPRVFDAGSEADTERCDHVPGPPCGNSGVRVTDGAEGTIHLDGGILGVGDLDPTALDWTHPAVTVTVSAGMGM